MIPEFPEDISKVAQVVGSGHLDPTATSATPHLEGEPLKGERMCLR